MPIKVRCPQCDDAFKTSGKNRGKKVDCPLCGASIRVSKRSRKAEKRGGGSLPGGEESFGEEIAAVLAEDDGLPSREFVPSVLDRVVEDRFGPQDPGLNLSGKPEGIADGAAGKGDTSAGRVGAGDLDPDTSYDAVAAYRPGQAPPATGLSGRRAVLPFVAGVLVGAVTASTALIALTPDNGLPETSRTVAASRPPAQTPLAGQPAAPRVEAIKPPRNADEKAALLPKVLVVKAEFVEEAGLLGTQRTIVLSLRNNTGLVLENVTVATTLSLAAFGDGALAKERVLAPFTPLLGLGEEQTVRVPAPAEGPIATAKLPGPVRLDATVIDLKWPKDAGA